MNIPMTSNSDEWVTPQNVFDKLNEEFHFDLDPAASEDNHKTDMFFTKEQDGLKCSWGGTERFVIRPIARFLSG